MEQIKNRFTGEVMCNGLSLAAVLERHEKWLRDEEGGEQANLSRADLSHTNLSGTNLSGADMSEVDLFGAGLSNTNLSGTNLSCANLSGADLCRANLSGADLSGAYLYGASLYDADLSRANLFGANLRVFKHDIWGVLQHAKHEVPNLIKAIKSGKIDGSCYEGECRCLCGTLEKGLKSELDIRDLLSPAEQWFSMIKKGDTPKNNHVSKMALEWIREWQGLQAKGTE